MVRARSSTSIQSDKQKQLSMPVKTQRAASVQNTGQTSQACNGSSDLRHAAIRNGLLRTTSGTTMIVTGQANHPSSQINRNIPMVPNEPKTTRNLGNRWANFTISQPPQSEKPQLSPQIQDLASTKPESREFTTASVSPLTYVKESTTESSHTAATTIVLANPSTPSTDNKFDNLHGDDAKLTSSRNSRASRFYHRMSLLVNSTRKGEHNSMNSQVPMTRYTSELDTSDEEQDLDNTEPDKDTDRDSNSRQETPIDLEEPVSVLDIMKEINDFQTTLVDRASPRKDNFTSTRTQQKLLDLKDLITAERGPAPGFSNLLDYSVKIQHEAILSEWTQIRLRFSSHITSRKGTNISCKAGVLGFVQRYKNQSCLTESLPMTEDNVNDYIREMWNEELLRLTESPMRIALPTYDEGVDIYKENETSMSSLARTVMLSRD